MARLGDGGGSGYPAVIDTTTTEINDPGGTLIDADKINDLADGIIKIQGELGIDPAGTLATVLARMAVEHGTNGTHSDITPNSIVLAGKIDHVKAGDLASATTVNVGAANGLIMDITGTTQIDQFDDVAAGIMRILRFDGALTWTHSATETVLPGSTDITTVAGDIAIVISEGSTNAWRCVSYLRNTVIPINNGWTFFASIDLTSGSPTAVSLVSSLVDVHEVEINIELWSSTAAANQAPMIQIGPTAGLEVTGYSGSGFSHGTQPFDKDDNSAGFFLNSQSEQDAADVWSGTAILRHMGSNIWSMQAQGLTVDHAVGGFGLKTLAGALTQATLTTSGGSNTFDGGTALVRVR